MLPKHSFAVCALSSLLNMFALKLNFSIKVTHYFNKGNCIQYTFLSALLHVADRIIQIFFVKGCTFVWHFITIRNRLVTYTTQTAANFVTMPVKFIINSSKSNKFNKRLNYLVPIKIYGKLTLNVHLFDNLASYSGIFIPHATLINTH
jgi:hypothetical protein